MSAPTAIRTALLLLGLVLPSSGAAAPPNDECVNATVVGVASDFAETVDTTTATTALDDPLQSCTLAGPQQNARSIWYEVVAPANGVLSVYTLDDELPADPPTIVSVHTGACGALTEVACEDSDTPLASYLHTPVAAGVTYRIAITNEAGSPGGSVHVIIYFTPDSPICPSTGGWVAKARLELAGIGAPAGAARVKISGSLALEGTLPDPTLTGMQILVEDEDAAYAPVVEWSAHTLALPPGAPGSGCDPRDGWIAAASGSSYRYRNVSGALPPTCAPGSANGLSDVKLRRNAQHASRADVRVKATSATFAHVPDTSPFAGSPRLRLAIALATAIAPGDDQHCATESLFICKVNGTGTKIGCKNPF